MSVPVLVVAVKPDAARVLARWGERFPELRDAVVLSPYQGYGAAQGLIVSRLYVDEVAYQQGRRDRRYVLLMQRLHRELIRSGGGEVALLLPRLAENRMVERPIPDLIHRPVVR